MGNYAFSESVHSCCFCTRLVYSTQDSFQSLASHPITNPTSQAMAIRIVMKTSSFIILELEL